MIPVNLHKSHEIQQRRVTFYTDSMKLHRPCLEFLQHSCSFVYSLSLWLIFLMLLEQFVPAWWYVCTIQLHLTWIYTPPGFHPEQTEAIRVTQKSQCNPVTGIILPYMRSKWEADLLQKHGQLYVKLLLTSNWLDCFEHVESQTQPPLLHTEQDTVCGRKALY